MVRNMEVGAEFEEGMYHVDAAMANGHQGWSIASEILLVGVESEIADEVSHDLS